nr:flotillin [Deltaproteobacteria bacterium]
MQEISGGIITLIVIGILFVLFLLITIYASRYVKCGPNEVLVISGGGWRRITDEDGEVEKLGFDIKKGGGAFIWPFFQKCEKLSLELMTLDIKGENVYTMKGVPVTVDGVAQVKVNGDDVSIRTAAEQFLSKGMTRRGEGMTEMQNTAL